MHFHIITLFPDSFDSYIHDSIIGRALKDKKIKVNFYNPRDFTKDKHRRVDQKPYGGGPGMVMEPLSVIKAVEKAVGKKKDVKVVMFSASGKEFTNVKARQFAKKYKHIVLICGRYEGIDARVQKVFKAEELSIGNYILTGGELPALVVLDSVSRQIKGVLGSFESLEEERVSATETYTRPELFAYKGKTYRVPKVLLSGHHKHIEDWKRKKKK